MDKVLTGKLLKKLRLLSIPFVILTPFYATLIITKAHHPNYINITPNIFGDILLTLWYISIAYFISDPLPSEEKVKFKTPNAKTKYRNITLLILVTDLLIAIPILLMLNTLGNKGGGAPLWFISFLITFTYFVPISLLTGLADKFRLSTDAILNDRKLKITSAQFLNGKFIYTIEEEGLLDNKFKIGDLVTIRNLVHDDGSLAKEYNLTYGVIDSLSNNTFTVSSHKDNKFNPYNGEHSKSNFLSNADKVAPLKITPPKFATAKAKTNSRGGGMLLAYATSQDTSYSAFNGRYRGDCQCFRCIPGGVTFKESNPLKNDAKILLKSVGWGFVIAYFGFTLFNLFHQKTTPVFVAIVIYLFILYFLGMGTSRNAVKNSTEYKININPEIETFIREKSNEIGTKIKFIGPPISFIGESGRDNSLKRGLDIESNAAFIPSGDKTGMIILGHAYQQDFDDITKSVLVHELGHSKQPWYKFIIPSTLIVKAILLTLNLLLLRNHSLLTYLTSSIMIYFFTSLISAAISRHYEKKADLFAAKILGKDVALKAFTNFASLGLGKDYPGIIAPLFISHPNNKKRIAYLSKLNK